MRGTAHSAYQHPPSSAVSVAPQSEDFKKSIIGHSGSDELPSFDFEVFRKFFQDLKANRCFTVFNPLSCRRTDLRLASEPGQVLAAVFIQHQSAHVFPKPCFYVRLRHTEYGSDACLPGVIDRPSGKGIAFMQMDEFQALTQLRQTPLCELEEVAKATKIPWATLVKIKYGTTKFPRLPALKKLVAWANRQNGVKAEAA
jgi:hypothetical protein